jgi:cold shock CspA family protein
MTGIVKMIKPELNCGVIEVSSSEHYWFSTVGVEVELFAGDSVEFEIIQDSRFAQAINVKRI